MLATTTKLIIASYGVTVPGALYLDKKDAQRLSNEAPGGIIEDNDGHAWRVQSVEFEEYSSESGAIVVTLETISALSA